MHVSSTQLAIIGGGFSGVMTAVNLARLGQSSSSITLINSQLPAGRGVAYGTRRMEHLLNVAARNMSAFPDLPDHFLDWLRTRSEYDMTPEHELRERFIPRMIYGDYLRSLMQHHLSEMRVMEDEALDYADGELLLAGGGRLNAARVILATGNEAPAALPGAETLRQHPGWVGNPWLPWHERLPPSTGTLILLGTGLTTVDAIITLRAQGWLGRIHAISRHGWLPQPHFRGMDYPDFPPPCTDLAALGLEKLLVIMEEHCARLRRMGANPAIIVDKMRPHSQRIWKNFSLEERLVFARHHAARWNVMRHRIAPEIHAQITSAQLTGQLQVHAAEIARVEPSDERVRVRLGSGKCLEGEMVINATGPQTRFSATRSHLLQNLLRRGLISSDDMDMGLRIDADHTIIDAVGRRSPNLLALGPLLRGTYWETIAVPELRSQARRVAQTLLGQTAIETMTPPVMMEYII